jgi:hypothetical protein
MDPEHAARSMRDFESLMDLFNGTDPFADSSASLAAELPTAASSSAACGAAGMTAQPMTPPWHRRSAPQPSSKSTSSASASAPNDAREPDATDLSQSDETGISIGARKRAWADSMGAAKRPSQEQHVAHKRQEISAEELQDLRDEADAARSCGIGWKERGPPGPPEDDPTATWRGQKWRAGTKRWANNGGSNRQWYSLYYAAKRHGDKAKMELFLQEHGDRFVYSASASGPKELREFVENRGADTW